MWRNLGTVEGSNGFHVETGVLWIAATTFINLEPPGATLTAALLKLAQMLFDGDASFGEGFHVETSVSRIAA